MSNATVRVSASPTQVREWAVDNGLVLGGQRGRLAAEIYSAYNGVHGLKAVEAKFVQTVRHTAKPVKGRSVTRTINIGQARTAALASGVFSGKRGRLPKSVLDWYVLNG